MGIDANKPLSDDDILRLGIEAGMRVNAMPEHPGPSDRHQACQELGMRAVELAYTQPTLPEDVDG